MHLLAATSMAERDEPPRPYATWTALGAIFAVAWFVTGFTPSSATLESVAWSRQAMLDGEWWRLVVSTFAHGGILHLGFNALALYSLGSLEREVGTPTYAAVFVLGALGGGLGHVLTSTTPAVGASGAIFGLLGLLLAVAPKTRLAFFGIPMPAAVLLMGYLSAVLLLPGLQDLAPIAHFAHIGGMLVGLAAGVVMHPKAGLRHLGFVGAVFSATLVLVSQLRKIQYDQLASTFRADGLLGVVVATWPAWLALLAVVGIVWLFDESADALGESEPT